MQNYQILMCHYHQVNYGISLPTIKGILPTYSKDYSMWDIPNRYLNQNQHIKQSNLLM